MVKKGDIFPLKQRVSATRCLSGPDGDEWINTLIERGEEVIVNSIIHEKMPQCFSCHKWHTSYVTVATVQDERLGTCLERCQL